MQQAGHSVRVLLSDYRHIEKKHRIEKKKDYRFFAAEPYKRNLSAARLHSHMQLSRDIFRFVNKQADRIDLLWVLVPPNSFAKDAADIKRKHPHIKLIFDFMDLWPESVPAGRIKKCLPFLYWKNLRDQSIDAADIVVTECNLYRKVLGKTLKGSLTETLYLAKPEFSYEPHLRLPDHAIALCYLGSINNIIDIKCIAEIILECKKKKPVILHIIGDGEKKNRLIAEAEKAGAKIADHGIIYDREEKQKIFDSCHYGLNIMKASVCVGMTMKNMDYLAFGLPIINNIHGDTWDAVNKYQIGINYKGRLRLNTLDTNPQRMCARSFFEHHLTEEVFREAVNHIISNTKKRNVTIRKSNYGFYEIVKYGIFLVKTAIQFPHARLVRQPVTVRGKCYIDWGKKLTTGYNCRFEVNGRHKGKVLIFGSHVTAGDHVSIRCAEKICIGNHVLLGSRVLIIDNSHGSYSGDRQDSPKSRPDERFIYTDPIEIQDRVWIGEGAVIQMVSCCFLLERVI